MDSSINESRYTFNKTRTSRQKPAAHLYSALGLQAASPTESGRHIRELSEQVERLTDEQFLEVIRKEVGSANPKTLYGNLREQKKDEEQLILHGFHMALGPPTVHVSIKIVGLQKVQRDLILSEIVTAREVHHTNIVKFYGSHLYLNDLWMVTELLEDGSMMDVVAHTQPSEDDIAVVCHGVAAALAALHSHRIVHRNIKSESIYLGLDGQIKLGDFGYSLWLDDISYGTLDMIGTPHWMAPEVASELPYDTRADVWSLGIMIFEMVDGEPPFYDAHPIEVLQLLRTGKFSNLSTVNKVSKQLEDLMSRMLLYNEEQRATPEVILQHCFLAKPKKPQSLRNLLHKARKWQYI